MKIKFKKFSWIDLTVASRGLKFEVPGWIQVFGASVGAGTGAKGSASLAQFSPHSLLGIL